ncbi:hypothetical protein BDK92_7412 [Micromonospora pisi]|uniref:Uncharacterized protein n=1 Tax=Micromonospora pisi TaxID=589240 RepID=A0A495JXD4_9ACTN|nr:hypothetical protein BDK92_7412 [Micromonospora pisi]
MLVAATMFDVSRVSGAPGAEIHGVDAVENH